MKIRDFIQRGREIYIPCHGDHHGIVSAARRVLLDLYDPEMEHTELRGDKPKLAPPRLFRCPLAHEM